MSRTCYEIDKKAYFFNNPRFSELIREKYPYIIEQPMKACTDISDALRKIYGENHHEVMDASPEEAVPGCHGIYGWYHRDKKSGLYTSPRNIWVVDALADLLNIGLMELLTKSHHIEIEELAGQPIKDSTDPLLILLGIILDYEKSTDYNYIPGTDEDGYEYYNAYIEKARALAIASSCTAKQLKLIESIKAFTNSCEGPDAVDDYLMNLNPKLAFFGSPFEIIEETGINGTIELYKHGLSMRFVPSVEQILERREYFDVHGENKDELFMLELAETVRNNYNSL